MYLYREVDEGEDEDRRCILKAKITTLYKMKNMEGQIQAEEEDTKEETQEEAKDGEEAKDMAEAMSIIEGIVGA